MYVLFFAVIVAYFIALAGIESINTKKLLAVPITEKLRIKNYIRIIIGGWGALLVIFFLSLFAGISFYDIGFRQLSFDQSLWFTITVFALCGLLFGLALYQIIAALTSKEYQKAVIKSFGNDPNKSNYDKVIALLIPCSKKEKIAFLGVPVTAGIMEEIVARGFLFFLLQMIFPYLSIVFVLIITSVLFGIAHIYQGVTGVIKSTLLGALFGCLYLVTGSLVPSILLHFFIDLAAVFMFPTEDNSTDAIHAHENGHGNTHKKEAK